MTKWISQSSTTGLLLLVAAMVGVMVWKLVSLEDKVLRAIQVVPARNSTMQTITQEVTNTQGATASISTTRLEGESLADWLQRHADAVVEFENT